MEANEQQLNPQTNGTSNGLAAEIKLLTDRLISHQEALGLGNREFAARYQQWLSSESTWLRLRNGNWQDKLNVEKTHRKLRDLVERLESARGFDPQAFLDQLPFVRMMNAQLERLLGSRGDRRGLVALAPEGVGKSWWSSSITTIRDGTQNKTTYFYVRLRSTWRDKPLHILRALALKLGAPLEKSPAVQQEALVDHMRSLGQMVVILDEAHNGGVALFKIVKDLIDETAWRFVYLAFPTQYDEVRSRNTGATAEARQFLRRCLRPIFDDYRTGITDGDVVAYLKGRGFKAGSEINQFAEHIAPRLANNYNQSTLADAVDDALAEADDLDRAATVADVRRAVESLTSSAAERRASAQARKEAK